MSQGSILSHDEYVNHVKDAKSDAVKFSGYCTAFRNSCLKIESLMNDVKSIFAQCGNNDASFVRIFPLKEEAPDRSRTSSIKVLSTK